MVSWALVIASCAAAHETNGDAGRLSDGAPSDSRAPSRDAPSVSPDVYVDDAWIGDVGPPPPRAIAPLSSATVTSRTPTLRWALHTGTDGAHVELCRDRALSIACASFDAAGSSGRPSAPLAPGAWFWRLSSRSGAVTGIATSAVWELFVGHGSADVDTSWGTTLDPNADGFADLAVLQMNAGLHLYLGGPGGIADAAAPAASLDDEDVGSVGSAGDVDGDGYPELLQAAGDIGRVYLRYGGPMGIDPHGYARAFTPAFGVSRAASVGDVNGDGYGDIVVTSGARVLIFHGGATGIAADAVQSTTIDAPIGSGSGFGASLAAADMNADGFGDLIVGSWHFDSAAVRIYVYFGGTAGLAWAPSVTLSLSMATSYDIGVACVDVNGDGHADLFVADHPAAYLFVAGPTGIDDGAPASARLDVASASGLYLPIAAPGDLDGDGYDELAIFGVGGVHVYRGSADGIATGAEPAAILAVPAASDGPFAMASAGDVDGDAHPDLVVGDAQSMGRGRVYVYGGGPTSITSTALPRTSLVSPRTSGYEYGYVVAAYGRWTSPPG